MVNQVQTVNQVQLVNQVCAVTTVTEVTLVQKVHLVDQVNQVTSSQFQVNQVTMVFQVMPVAQVLQVQWVHKVHQVFKVQPVQTVTTVFQVNKVNQVQKVHQVLQVSKVESVHQVPQVTKVKMAHQVPPVLAPPTTVTLTLDTLKPPMFHLALPDTQNFGKVTLSFTPPVTNEPSLKILVLQALVFDLSPPCHSSSVTSTNNVTLPAETTTLTGCLPMKPCHPPWKTSEAPISNDTSPDALSAKPQPNSLPFTLKTKKPQTAQLTGKVLTGLVSVLSCTLVLANLVEDKISNLPVLVSKPSDPLHSLNVTVKVLATTSALPSVSGWLLSKKNSLPQLLKL
jgi:hypothetical protein